jgi:hypothetical protein
MAKTFQAAGAAIVANAANFANMGLASAAEATAVGNFLIAAGGKPGLSVEILRLVNTTELTENRP